MSKQRPTSFLDLPPELRLVVYNYLLPHDRVMTFPARAEEQTIMALWSIRPVIREELEDVIYEQCNAHITVRSEKAIGLPTCVNWGGFEHLTIMIDYYHSDPSFYDYEDIKEVVQRLNALGQDPLASLEIYFREDPVDGLGDLEWTMDVLAGTSYQWRDLPRVVNDGFHCATGRLVMNCQEFERNIFGPQVMDRVLRLSEPVNGYERDPIVTEILACFMELWPCERATVRPLTGLTERRLGLVRHDPEHRIFDQRYMKDMCATLESWLAGVRGGSYLPPDGTGTDCPLWKNWRTRGAGVVSIVQEEVEIALSTCQKANSALGFLFS